MLAILVACFVICVDKGLLPTAIAGQTFPLGPFRIPDALEQFSQVMAIVIFANSLKQPCKVAHWNETHPTAIMQLGK